MDLYLMTKERKPLTEEQREARRANLARGRLTAAANRAKKALSSAEAPSEPGHGNSSLTLALPDRERLLFGVDPEIARLITDEELTAVAEEERAKAGAEQKKKALADVRAAARQQAMAEHDLIAASALLSDTERKRLAKPVTFRVNLPGDGAGHVGRNGFRVDGQLFQVGQTYTRSQAVFESLRANHYRTWLQEIQFRTLDQHKPGNSAVEIMHRTGPRFEVIG